MGRAVFAHQPRPVDGKQHVQILDGNVVNQLVIAPLQEGRIDCHDRFGTITGQPGRQGYRVLLCDGYVKVAVRETLRERQQV